MSEIVRAGIYTRISLASLGDNTKVDDQERICRRLAGQLGWEVLDDVGHPHHNGVYCDHSKSAWQKNRKRPAWDQMLRDVDGGRINGIIVYHGDRLVRRPEDLADLLRLADNKGVRLASPTGTHNLDTQRLELWIRAAFAEEESTRTSERRKTQYERWRREGRVRPGGRGGRAYGFATDGSTWIDGEIAFIREAAARVLAGEAALTICRDLTARGARMPTGRPFDHGALKKLLMRPRLAGLMPDGVHQAAWEPVLDRETWEAVCAVLDAKAAGFGYATNARRYLLSGIARCGACGTGLQIRVESRRTHLTGYGCVKPGCRKVQRSRELLDEYVITRALAKLNDPANPPGRVPASPGLGGEFRALAIQRAETETAIADHTKGGALPILLRRLESIDARLAELRELAAGSAQARLLSSHAGLTRAQWDDLPLATRRALVMACFTITVLSASRRGPGFRTEDVRLAKPGS